MNLIVLLFFVASISINILNTSTSTITTKTTSRLVPVARLKEGRQKLGTSENYITEFPRWVNTTLLKIGQKFLQKNYVQYLYSVTLSTMLTPTSADQRRIAVSTGNTSNINTVTKRYLINILHLSFWTTIDLKKDKADLMETFNLLHAVHAKIGHAAHAKKHIYAKPLIPASDQYSNPFKIDLKLWDNFDKDLRLAPSLRKFQKKPVFPPKTGGTDYCFNQLTMSMQQWAFIAYVVMSPKSVYIYDATDEDLMGAVHLWALIGRSLGIQDEYNICLQPNLKAAREYFRGVMEVYFLPALFHMDYEARVILEYFIKGLGGLFPILDSSGLRVYHLCQDILKIDCPNVKRSLKSREILMETSFTNTRKTLFQYDTFKSYLNFVVNGLIQAPALKNFNFNTFVYKNFTKGLIALDEDILRTSNVYFQEQKHRQFNS